MVVLYFGVWGWCLLFSVLMCVWEFDCVTVFVALALVGFWLGDLNFWNLLFWFCFGYVLREAGF